MKQIFTVAGETYGRHIKSWSFVFMVFFPFLMIFVSLGGGYLSSSLGEGQGEEAQTIAIVTQDESLDKKLKTIMGDVTYKYDTEAEAKKALKDEKIVGYLLTDGANKIVTATYKGQVELNVNVKTQILDILQSHQEAMNVAKAKLSKDQYEAMSQQIAYSEVIDDRTSSERDLAELGEYLGFILQILFMYLILIVYSSSTAQEIASEKGTKIMEVIFSSVPAARYFFGRILGIFGVIATHIGIYVLGGVGLFLAVQNFEATKDLMTTYKVLIDAVLDNFSIITIGFVIIGVLLYVVLSALCGALVTRAEDANKAVQPAMILIMLGFFGAMYLGNGADNLLLKVGSYLPFLSTFFMPIRLMNGYATQLESLISVVVLSIFTLGFTFYIGKSYAGLILQTDDLGLWKSFRKGMSNK